ncbi:hypothetical protein ACDT18_14065, partial [Staphylococcus aureus]
TDDAENADGHAMSAGDKLTLKAGKNLRVKRDGADFTFALNNTVDLTNAGSLTIGGTTVTNDGVTIKAKEAGKTNVTLTANGLDNGGNKIVTQRVIQTSPTSLLLTTKQKVIKVLNTSLTYLKIPLKKLRTKLLMLKVRALFLYQVKLKMALKPIRLPQQLVRYL